MKKKIDEFIVQIGMREGILIEDIPKYVVKKCGSNFFSLCC